MSNRVLRYSQTTLMSASLLVLVLASLALTEIALRLAGWETWQVEDQAIKVEPGGRLFASDDLLGYTHRPGRFRVELGSGFSFHVGHGGDTLRLTDTDGATAGDERPEIWLLGCSFTHGWSLNDDESYPWLLQQAMPEFHVLNFGVSGYGTAQSLLQLQRELGAGRRPAAIVLGYAHFHDVRNTFVRKRRKQVAPWNQLGHLNHPRARFDRNGELQIDYVPVTYEEFPLMRHSALVHAIERLYNDYEAWQARSPDVTLALIAKIADLAGHAGVPFAVAGITDSRLTSQMLALTERRGIPTVDISTDLNRDGYTNKPHDAHPSSLATREIADKLGAYLRDGPLLHSVDAGRRPTHTGAGSRNESAPN